MRATVAVLATNHGIIDLLQDREELLIAVVRSLVNALDAKDSSTCGHSDRVREFARLTARTMGLSEIECEQIHMAGLLHDIVKAGIPDNVLNKPGHLTSAERKMIERHPVTGYEILRHLTSFEYVLPGVLYHHQAMDGTGYPYRLQGTDIPLPARILAVADEWDAMASDRSYRCGMPAPEAEKILLEGAGTQWDPVSGEGFLRSCRDYQIRIDGEHTDLAAPGIVRSATIACMARWPAMSKMRFDT